MGKSIFTMSAKERMKHQAKESKKIDRLVAKKMKAAKRTMKRVIAGKLLKIMAFFAVAIGAGMVAAKGKEAVGKKVSAFLKEIALKMKEQEEEDEWDIEENEQAGRENR